MYKMKKQTGITLVALIITIIILLILAVVAIGAVNDGGIIEHAQSASNQHTIGQEKEEINLAILEWKLANYTNPQSLFEFLEDKFVNVSESGNIITITMPSNNKYTVENNQVNGPVESEKTITLSTNTIILEPNASYTIGVNLSESLIGKTVTFSSSQGSVATVNSEGVVTAVATGTTTITATCEGITATCAVTVLNPTIAWTCTGGSWSSKITITESTDLGTYDTIAKIYEIGGNYTLVLEGQGRLGEIINDDEEVCKAWFEDAYEGDMTLLQKINNVIIKEGITYLPIGCFMLFTEIESVIVPEGVTEIGACAFQGCENLSYLELPASLERVDYDFIPHTNLSSVTYRGNMAAWENVDNKSEVEEEVDKIICADGTITIP